MTGPQWARGKEGIDIGNALGCGNIGKSACRVALRESMLILARLKAIDTYSYVLRAHYQMMGVQ
jgi:hypothetical protein